MILVWLRRGPDDVGFEEWQDLLMTLALFSLPLTVVLSGNAARSVMDPRLEQRLEQLIDIGVQSLLIHQQEPSVNSEPPFPVINDAALRTLSASAKHLVHC